MRSRPTFFLKQSAFQVTFKVVQKELAAKKNPTTPYAPYLSGLSLNNE